MEDYEKLGTFYLGRPYSLEDKKAGPGLLLYDSKDLVTHAVCLGMTGSGKTGLCISLLEEAAIDGVPAIAIDPKGDLPNLLLTFPQLRGEDFLPWINEEEARRANLSPEEFARQQAERWKTGLEEWGQGGDRIARLRAAAEFAIYTPGSTAGIPVSILKSFAAPDPATMADKEFLAERIGTTVASLLGLVGIQADPIKSREHILLSSLLDWAWQRGQNPDLPSLIQLVQSPPLAKVGVLDLEAFYPSQDRFALVMAMNNLLAAPGFSTWLEGEPLDIGKLLYAPSGKPRVCIFSIAHLNDAERMSFVALLLSQVIGWMRAQSGTGSLRAILYMDEVFGFLPPVAVPPSKPPLLTLLKQARAFGLGVVLATQNPVDLDYKALSNAGTWFIGRLQTERDKARLLDGLEGVSASGGSSFDRGTVDKIVSSLGARVFLMNNTHDDAPEVFQTRWAMSYLRGPLTRNQIKALMDPVRGQFTSGPQPAQAQALSVSPAPSAVPAAAEKAAPAGPGTLAEGIPQYFLPVQSGRPANARLVYRPSLLGAAELGFADAKAKVDTAKEVSYLTPITDEPVPVDWDAAAETGLPVSRLEKQSGEGAEFQPLPSAATKPKSYTAWSKAFTTWLFTREKLELFKSPGQSMVSQPGESERDFRIRLQQSSREQRDATVEKLRQKYAPRMAALQERLRKAQQAVAREEEQAKQQKVQTAISFGSTLLGAFVGRKALSASTLGRATTAARGVSRSAREAEDVSRAKESADVIEAQLAELETAFKAETEALERRQDPQVEALETITIKPKKTQIAVQLVALAWAPYWVDAQGTASPAWR